VKYRRRKGTCSGRSDQRPAASEPPRGADALEKRTVRPKKGPWWRGFGATRFSLPFLFLTPRGAEGVGPAESAGEGEDNIENS
jgi:hypothetical protein